MIAIKDFKMPRGCYECQFADESIRMDCDYYCQAAKEKPDVQYGLNKPDWCPLVDVPDMNVGNCSEFPNNSDSVSRQTAVEAIANQSRFSAEEIINICDKSVQDENGWLGGLKEAILAVLELPSAEPETDLQPTCNEVATDCVSRQAVFDALEGEITVTGWKNAVAVKEYANLALDRIKRLPAVQHEIIRCRDCVWSMTGDFSEKFFCSLTGALVWAEPDSFCSYAVRKINGSD